MNNIAHLLEDYLQAQSATAGAKHTQNAASEDEVQVAKKLFALIEPIAIAKDRDSYKSLGRPALVGLKQEGSEVVATLGFFVEDNPSPLQEATVRFGKARLIATVLAAQLSQQDESESPFASYGESKKVAVRRPGR